MMLKKKDVTFPVKSLWILYEDSETAKARECRRGESTFGLKIASNPEAAEKHYIRLLFSVWLNT